MAWIYPDSLSDVSFGSGPTTGGWSPWAFLYGGHFVLAAAGTVSMMGVYCKSSAGASRGIKFGLYDSSGTLIAQSTGSVSSSVMAWVNSGAISESLAAGTYYVLISSEGDGSSYVQYGYNTGGSGSFATEAYSTAMASTETITGQGDPGYLYGVRLDFTASAGPTLRNLTLLGVG